MTLRLITAGESHGPALTVTVEGLPERLLPAENDLQRVSAAKVEEIIGRPLSPYGAGKYMNELYADAFSRCYGIATIGLRSVHFVTLEGATRGPDALARAGDDRRAAIESSRASRRCHGGALTVPSRPRRRRTT